MITRLYADAKANRNMLAAEPHVTVTRHCFPVGADDWQEPAVVASHTGPIGARQDATLDIAAADEILAALGYRRISEWATGDAPNLSPSGQWHAEVEQVTPLDGSTGMSETAPREALVKTLRDGRTAVVTVEPVGYLHTAATILRIDGNEAGSHLGPHHAVARETLARYPGHVAAIGPMLLTEDEAAQIKAVYLEVAATIPPDLDAARDRLADELNAAGQEPGLRAAGRMDSGDYGNPFGTEAENAEDERRIAAAAAALGTFDAEHPEIAAKARARRDAAVQRALEGRD